jgi:hypothetical protein
MCIYNFTNNQIISHLIENTSSINATSSSIMGCFIHTTSLQKNIKTTATYLFIIIHIKNNKLSMHIAQQIHQITTKTVTDALDYYDTFCKKHHKDVLI